MLTGQRLFRGDTPADTMSAILTKDPPEFPDGMAVPPAMERIVRHCLEKYPEERFQSARDLAFALDAVSQTSGRELPAKAMGRDRKWPRWLLAGAVLLS